MVEKERDWETCPAGFDVKKFAEALDCTDAAGLGALEKKLSSENAKGQNITCKFEYDTKTITVSVGSGDNEIKSSNK